MLITWPLVTMMSTHFAGYPFGDAHEMTRHIWWIKHALQTGQSIIFQPALGYPDGMQGVILWSDPLQFFPGWLFAFFMPLPAAYNLFVLLTLALNGWAAYYLVWKLTAVRPAALVGGVVFLAAPTIQSHLAGGHGGLLVQWPLVLLAASLQSLVISYQSPVTSRQSPATSHQPIADSLKPPPLITRHSLLAILFFFLSLLGHTLQLIYTVMPLMGVLGITLLMRREWRALLRLIIVCIAGSLLLALFLLPVFNATFGTSAYTGEGGGVDFSADLLSVVTPSFNHPFFGQLDYSHRVLGVNIVEGHSYVGIIPALLGLLAAWKVRAARWWLGVAIVAHILSLGPLLKLFDQPVIMNINGYETRITLPWAVVYDLPGFSLARTPGRFNFLLALAVAVMAGYGVSELRVKTGKLKGESHQLSAIGYRLSAIGHRLQVIRGWYSALVTRYSLLVTLLLAVLILLDYQAFWPLPTTSAEIPQEVYGLAGRDDVRAVFDIPWDNLLAAKDALWLQTAHRKPMIAGQVTRRTPVSPAKLTILQQTLDSALLDEARIDVVIVHKNYDLALVEATRLKLGEPFYEDENLALFESPPVSQPPEIVDIFSDSVLLNNQADFYIYVRESGWVNLDVRHTILNRTLSLLVDNRVVFRWLEGTSALPLRVPLATATYHTLSLRLDPPCPEHFSETLACDSMLIGLRQITDYQPMEFAAPVIFDHGIQLLGASLHDMTTLDLWWQFDQPRIDQDIRFIKVLDENGEQIAGADETLGTHESGSQWIETVTLDLPADVKAGQYRVYVGWYTYPDLTRFPVLSDVEGAQDGLALIDEFTVTP